MKQTIQVADKPTADETKSIVESNAEKLDDIAQQLESGGMLADPEHGLAALKQYIDELKNYVGNGKRNVAGAITAKGITTATDAGFATLADNIDKIVTLMHGTQDATAGAGQVLSGYTAYARGSKITGSVPSQGAQTITPGTSAKYVEAGRYLSGRQTIAGDANLAAGNIKKGVSIFGVAGNLQADMTFVKNDVSTIGGNYGSTKNLRLVEFKPHSFTFSTPGGTVTATCGSYDSNCRTLFFVPVQSETISNVVFLKEIQYSHGSSGYMGYRTEPQFAWNAPNLSQTYNVYSGKAVITGDNKLCLFFPNVSDNGEYGQITTKKILAYCY